VYQLNIHLTLMFSSLNKTGRWFLDNVDCLPAPPAQADNPEQRRRDDVDRFVATREDEWWRMDATMVTFVVFTRSGVTT